MDARKMLGWLAALSACPIAARCQQEAPFTQYRINEIAAPCVTAEIAFHEYRGTLRPGETPGAFAKRIEGYVAALDTLDRDLAPIRHPPAPRDSSPVNVKRWKSIEQNVALLPQQTASLRAAWKIYPAQGPKAQLPRRLADCVAVFEDILNGLRDARP